MKKFGTITINIFYTALVVAVLSLALLFVGTKIDIFGYEVKIVKSGSMEPAIQTGGIVVVSPTETYKVGEVVTYGRDTRNRIPVTHRIIEKTGEGNRATYLTKGDANTDIDPRTVGARDIIGKVAFTIPYVGYVIDFARTPLGFILLVGLPALVIVLDELANIMWEVHKYRYLRRKHQTGRQGKRGGQTGYRVPSRERSSRDYKASNERPQTPREREPKLIRPYENHVLDLRHYRLKRPQA